MKSKTHHKKCVELGISPIPTTVPDDYNGGSSPGLEGVPGPSGDSSGSNGKPVAGDSDSDDEDMEEDEEEDEDQFEDAENDDDIEIIGEDNGMVAKGLLPYRPRLSTYPYRSESSAVVKKEDPVSSTAASEEFVFNSGN